MTSFNLAKAITSNLELDIQIWLVDYLQYIYWHKTSRLDLIASLEKSKKLLSRYVQPRLVWECFFWENIR